MSENLFDNETVEAPAKKRGRPPKAASAGGDIAPLVAAAKIVYGAGQNAAPGDFFVPSSEAERDYLLELGAAVELTEAEIALYEKING